MFASLLLTAASLNAAQSKEARVTRVVNNVKLFAPQAAPHPAAVSDSVRDGDAIRTGAASRSELTFAEQAIVRFGAKTLVSFSDGTRTMNLGEGAMLFQIFSRSRKVLQEQRSRVLQSRP